MFVDWIDINIYNIYIAYLCYNKRDQAWKHSNWKPALLPSQHFNLKQKWQLHSRRPPTLSRVTYSSECTMEKVGFEIFSTFSSHVNVVLKGLNNQLDNSSPAWAFNVITINHSPVFITNHSMY